MGKIWQRYILFQFLKPFCLFLAAFYFLYVVIDSSIHAQDFFTTKNLSFFKILKYYFFHFIKRADILFPLATMIATIKTFCGLNTHRELIAFQTAHLHKKTLLLPGFFVAISLFVATLAINEFAIPSSLNFLDNFHASYFRHSYHGKRKDPFHVIELENHSKIIYQSYDSVKEALFDVFWLENTDELWKMKYLKLDATQALGQWVDHLVRSPIGNFEKVKSYPHFLFKNLKCPENLTKPLRIPLENYSLRQLGKMLSEDPHLSHSQRQEALTQLLFKCTMPMLPFFTMMAVAPFCLNFSRKSFQLWIYGVALFSFVTFIALMDALVILGESGVLSPYLAILTPFILLSTVFGWRFIYTK